MARTQKPDTIGRCEVAGLKKSERPRPERSPSSPVSAGKPESPQRTSLDQMDVGGGLPMYLAIRRRIEVAGIVQGVGFRPYICRLATENHLAGTIRNTSSGVSIEVEGAPPRVHDFMARLPQQAPPLSRITEIQAFEMPCHGDREFRIVASHADETVRTLISPDVATCADCLREMFDPDDRRYRYPFINCTNCGPRFTITHSIPYDRRFTSMAVFPMCPACQAEYDDLRNRRFHAQPNACWDCGPQLELRDRQGRTLATDDPVRATIEFLRLGHVAAVKGLGGFHLAADAANSTAVACLRARKRRVGKPFAIMVADVPAARALCEISASEESALLSMQRPIVLLRRLPGDSSLSEHVAPGNPSLGVFLPYTPLHHLILREGGFKALVMTSGNLSEEPIAIANQEAVARLHTLTDCFLLHNRDILLRCDDSVVRVVSAGSGKSPRPRRWGGLSPPARKDNREFPEEIQQLRRARGFVPVPVFLREEIPSILAVGGELKNTICLTQGKHAFLSQHVGDLENLESYTFFEEAIRHFQKVLEIRPEIVAYDLHPDYFSTRWALEQNLPRVGVQHHHAHIASCMAENHLQGKVIGFALDGTGYGADGKIWGGEVLVADCRGFERAAHFAYIPLPGGAAAIHEPWRMAVSYLAHHFGRDFLKRKPAFLNGVSPHKIGLLLEMLDRRVNSPPTSSCGRLFDAVAAIAGVRNDVTYEAQAAMELEMAMENGNGRVCGKDGEQAEQRNPDEFYQFELSLRDSTWVIGTRPLFEALLEDVAARRSVSEISRKFHNGLIASFCEIAKELRKQNSLNRVCLSGGTFNNFYLRQNLVWALSKVGFEVFTQGEVPTGDGGLSLGQAMVAAQSGNSGPSEGWPVAARHSATRGPHNGSPCK